MNRIAQTLLGSAVILVLSVAVLPGNAGAATLNDYCITPSFIQASVPANLLMLFDNSSSMYDLAYADKGKKHCSVTTAKSCAYNYDCSYCSATTSQKCYVNADCPSGETCNTSETCSVFDRQPYYCFDETYSNANSYAGYFANDSFYYYRAASDDFAVLADPFPGPCTATKSIANTMCVQYDNAARTLQQFVAKGNYLNWLTSSKLDVQKKILTGGKYMTKACSGSKAACTVNGDCPSTETCVDATSPFLKAESRGCVGQGFVKQALTDNFENFSGTAANDVNTALGVTFTIRSEPNPTNPSAPYAGGQTYIDLFSVIGKNYDYAACQRAVDAIATGNNSTIKQEVSACLQDTSPVSGTCRQKATQSCTTSAECILNTGVAQSGFVCTQSPTKTCTGTTDATSCTVGERKACSGDATRSCTSDANCQVVVAEKMGSCGTTASYTPTLPSNLKGNIPASCRTNAGCTITDTNNKGVTTTYTAPCTGYVAGSTTDYGTCVTTPASDFGPCISNYVGECVLSSQAAAVKTKVSFQQSMQACWQLREGHAIGNDEVNSVKNQCSDVYGGFAVCSNNTQQFCSTDAECGAGNTCLKGPNAIVSGNPALICGTNYAGQLYKEDPVTHAWVLVSSLPASVPAACAVGDSVDDCIRKIHTQFCGDTTTPNVVDPTDAASDTAKNDNTPAILSGVGVESQLGQPLKSMRAKVATDSAPTGLIQEFASKIRIGTMSFNYNGSAAEVTAGVLPVAKVCSNDTTKSCTQKIDCCASTGTCTCDPTTVGTTNKDGARVTYRVGLGKCYDTTTSPPTLAAPLTVCATDRTCGTGQTCVVDGPGDHVTADTLVKTVDDIVANAWTPFSEAFYEAIGYFGNRKTCGGTVGNSNCEVDTDCGSGVKCTWSGVSRTDLRLYANDYNENYNPSNYKCQKNFVLLISDGMSTADRNSSVDNLAKLYTAAGGATSWVAPPDTGACPPFGGSRNLDNMAWIAHNRDISSFKTDTASTLVPSLARDFITTYVVFNGESNGLSGECDSETLLKQTAINGGTTLKQANDYNGLVQKLRSVFEDVAAQSASGTAASILSNSEGSGANLLQALFFPKKEFDAGTSTLWSGELHNLWYYFNPLLTTSSVREDTDGNNQLDLAADRVINFFFDNNPQSPSYNQTMANRYQDVFGDDTTRAFVDKVTPDDVKSLWRAGKLLWSRSSARNILTPCLAGVTCTDSKTLAGGSATRLMTFSAANDASLQPFMQTLGSGAGSETADIINYVHGTEFGGYRSRTISIKNKTTNVTSSGVWKLGDIISSTPRLQSTNKLNSYDQPAPVGYNDKTYTDFTSTTEYGQRGMVYVGANDGMLHAFNLGVLDVTPSGTRKATITDPHSLGLGTEVWSFIPRNALPYLRYLSCKNGNGDAFCNNADYSHLYYVDGQTTIVDAAIGKPAGCTAADVADCLKNDRQSWRSVLISGMGLGGASRDATSACVEGSAGTCVKTPITGEGYSSYFALDVTDPTSPLFKWEFSDAVITDATKKGLGFATTGAATVKINALTSGAPDRGKNGKWFAVFGSGPTGPIDKTTHQFLAKSNQPVKIYVVALDATPPFVLNSNYWVLDKVYNSPTDAVGTTLDNAFVGSMSNAAIDTDRAVSTSPGFYSDDALYFGYVQQTGATALWESGGVLRLVTNEDPNPANWRLSKVIDSMGPVVTAVARLQDRKNKNLWLFFGAGRYFFKDDDLDTSRRIYAVSEPCYKGRTDLDPTCYDKYVPGDLTNKTTANNNAVTNGWYIGLEAQNTPTVGYGAERVISDPVALTNGAVFFTSFKPTTDVCGFGGNSYLWATAYDTGNQAPSASLQGRALIQLSTGEFKEVDLAGAFTDKDNRRMATPMTGKPPSDPPPLVSKSNLKPVKKILHIQEK